MRPGRRLTFVCNRRPTLDIEPSGLALVTIRKIYWRREQPSYAMD